MERRVFLSLVGPAAMLPLGVFVMGCEKQLKCDDSGGLSAEEAQLRARFAYVDHSTDHAKMCEDCIHFQPGDGCGRCKVLPGPIHPQGTCSLFMAR